MPVEKRFQKCVYFPPELLEKVRNYAHNNSTDLHKPLAISVVVRRALNFFFEHGEPNYVDVASNNHE